MGETDAYDKVLLARNENRPHFLDYINGIVDDWTYLAGDRLFGEDPAMCGGIGYWRGIPSVIIGQEKGAQLKPVNCTDSACLIPKDIARHNA